MKWRHVLCTLFIWAAAGQALALCINPLCTCVVATSSLNFGNYNPLASPHNDAIGDVAVDCGGVIGLLIPLDIALSKGTSNTYANRAMANGAQRLTYNIFTDSTYTTIWGDGSGGSQFVSSGVTLDVLGLAPAKHHPVHGRIFSRQTAAVPGVYSDSITVTVTYY